MPKPLRLLMFAMGLWAFAPLSFLLIRSFESAGTWGLRNYSGMLGRPERWTPFLNSVLLAGATTVIALCLAVPVAFLATKSTISGRTWLVSIFCAPLAFPPYVLANGWFRILGRGGILATAAGSGSSADGVGAVASAWLFSLPGGILVLSTAFMPVVILLSMAAFAGVDPALEDAGRISAPWPRVLRGITLPLAGRGITMAAVLTFLLAMGEFGAPSFLRLKVFSVESFTQLSAFYDSGAATAAWTPLLLAIVVCIWSTWRVAGPGERYFRWSASDSRRISFGSWSPWISAAAWGLAILLVVLPCVALIMDGFSRIALTEAWDRAADSLKWSLLYASLAATAISAAGFLYGYASQRKTFRFSSLITPGALILFATPGTLAGFASVIMWNRPATAGWYSGVFPLVSSLTIQYFAVGQLGFAAALSQVPQALEEAGQISGAGWFRRIVAIVQPQVRSCSIAVWVVTFILCLRETILPLLLSPPGRDPLTARTFTLMANGSPDLIAALCLFSIALPVIPACLGLWLIARPWSRHD